MSAYLVERHALLEFVEHAFQRYEVLSARYHSFLKCVMVWVILDWIAAQTGNLSGSFETIHCVFAVALTEDGAVVVQVLALDLVVFAFDK